MPESEVEKIFERLPRLFQKGSVDKERVFYFSLGDDEKWTVEIRKDKCAVKRGKTEDADCFFKASEEMFLKVWNGHYTPSAKDFVSAFQKKA